MRFGRRQRPEPLAPARPVPQRLERIDGEPVLNIFVLGTAGAGKTVFLTSLWNFLSVMDRERNFFITCPNHDHEQILRNQYKTLIDPNAPWFPGSYEVGEFLFRTYYKMPGGQDLSLFRIRYFDFPGGFVSAPWRTADNFSVEGASAFSVEGAAAKAHSVLALLDGKKIFNLLEKVKVPYLESIYYDLDELVYVLHKCVGRPIHFAITKADLLDKQKHSLARIKSELMEHAGFKKIVELQPQRSPMYMMPVSAVGCNFATMDLSSGKIKKKPNGILRPFNIDTCLCLTLVDQVKELAKSTDAIQIPVRLPYFIIKWLLVMLTATRESLDYFVDVLGPFTTHALRKILEAAERRGAKHESELRREIDEIVQSIKDRQSAFSAVLQIQIMRVQSFLEKLPDAILTDRSDH